jgi:hypothetical protein
VRRAHTLQIYSTHTQGKTTNFRLQSLAVLQCHRQPVSWLLCGTLASITKTQCARAKVSNSVINYLSKDWRGEPALHKVILKQWWCDLNGEIKIHNAADGK